MARIKPFAAHRPASGLEDRVASRPYDVLNSHEARAERAGNDMSFLRIIKPEVDMDASVDAHDQSVYDQGARTLDTFFQKRWLVQDEAPAYYIYRLVMDDHTQHGLVCCSAIDDYVEGVIKKHEYTRPAKEDDRVAHMRTLGAHPGPVFLTYPAHAAIDALVAQTTDGEPAFDFTSDDGVRHTGWAITDPAVQRSITDLFATEVPHTYVADGHHRTAASARVGLQLRQENPDHDGSEPYNHFLTVLFPDNQLRIIDYNRVVRDLNGQSAETFLAALGVRFKVERSDQPVRPTASDVFGMYMEGAWHRLTARPGLLRADDPIGALGITVLSDHLIDPVLGISDQRTSDRIDFIGGIRGLGELERLVDSGEWAVAFSVPPVSVAQLMAVADADTVMPPKSTWFEPKLRSGLFVHRFS